MKDLVPVGLDALGLVDVQVSSRAGLDVMAQFGTSCGRAA